MHCKIAKPTLPRFYVQTVVVYPCVYMTLNKLMSTSRSASNIPLVIATRESRLALWQANHVAQVLAQHNLTTQILGMTTQGDQILDRSLSKVGGKGLFVKELEAALLDRRADLAVHSLKDVPMDLPPALLLAAIMQREDPRDAFVSGQYSDFHDLPQGARVGTSSLRRSCLLRALRPDLQIMPLRGNLDTRLRKLDHGEYDAIVLAAAGLKRLGLENRIRHVFPLEEMPPAPGQGALGLEIRAADSALLATLSELHHTPTALAVWAERAVSRALGGSCSMPLAAHARFVGDELLIHASLGHATALNEPLLHVQLQSTVTHQAQAEALGIQAAQTLKELGGLAYLPPVAP